MTVILPSSAISVAQVRTSGMSSLHATPGPSGAPAMTTGGGPLASVCARLSPTRRATSEGQILLLSLREASKVSVAVAIVDLAASAIDVDDAFAVTAPEEEEEDRRLEAGPLLGEAAIISPLFMTRHKEQEV